MAQGKKTPNKIKKLQGTFKPSREVQNEMQPPAVNSVDTPSGLINEYANREWLKITRILSDLGMLAETDMSLLLFYCNELGISAACYDIIKKNGYTFSTPNGFEQQRPEVLIGNKALQNVIKLSDKFGFNPAARTKIEAPAKQDKDPFDEL